MFFNDAPVPAVLDITEYRPSRREYFAGLAMQGLLVSGGIGGHDSTLAKYSIKIADDLLNELEVKPFKKKEQEHEQSG